MVPWRVLPPKIISKIGLKGLTTKVCEAITTLKEYPGRFVMVQRRLSQNRYDGYATTGPCKRDDSCICFGRHAPDCPGGHKCVNQQGWAQFCKDPEPDSERTPDEAAIVARMQHLFTTPQSPHVQPASTATQLDIRIAEWPKEVDQVPTNGQMDP